MPPADVYSEREIEVAEVVDDIPWGIKTTMFPAVKAAPSAR